MAAHGPRLIGSGASRADDGRSVATLAALAGADLAGERMGGGLAADRVAQRSGAKPVDDRDPFQAGQRRVVEVAGQRVERLLHAGAAQVE